MKEVSKLTFFYVKKLFGIKNIIFFLIIFFCSYTLFHTFQIISNATNSGSDAGHTANILRDNWILRILFAGTFINFSTTYSYIYLKKNNYANITNLKNSFCNSIIVFTMAFIGYFVMAFFLFLDYNSNNVLNTEEFNQSMHLLIDMFLFNLVALLTVSLFNVKNKHGHIFVSVVFIVCLILFFHFLQTSFWMTNDQMIHLYNNFIFYESGILFILLAANFVKRTPKIMNQFYKYGRVSG